MEKNGYAQFPPDATLPPHTKFIITFDPLHSYKSGAVIVYNLPEMPKAMLQLFDNINWQHLRNTVVTNAPASMKDRGVDRFDYTFLAMDQTDNKKIPGLHLASLSSRNDKFIGFRPGTSLTDDLIECTEPKRMPGMPP